MKTIQIPTTSNPFIVNINNTAYQYRAGESTEVPAEVAEAIEDALELEPKPKRYLSKLAQLAEDSLTELTASDFDGINKISSYAFYKHFSLTDVTFNSSITTIGACAFYSCGNLLSVRFGDHSKADNIGFSAFEWCEKLKHFYLPMTPPILENANAFANIKPACVFYCKTQESLDAYKAAPIWSELTGTYSFVVEA